MAVAVKPSNSLLNIRSGIKSIKDSFSGLRKNAGNLNDVVLKKTKVKRESIIRNAILSQRRQEQERRKNKEDLLEASTIGGAVKRQAKAVASSTKGFLGRIMDFLATLLVGWLLTNLPSIITMAQELIARIQRLYTIVTGFFDNTIKLFRGFGNLLGAVGKNILTFDFMDSKGRVESSLKDLGGTFEDMQKQFDEGFRLLTTSLGEGVVSGENAAPFGTQYENESMQQQPSGGGQLTSIHKQALDIISGPESGGSYNAMNQGTIGDNIVGSTLDSKTKIRKNLTDMTIGEVIQRQKWLMNKSNPQVSDYGVYAAGRYQFIPNTLPGVMKSAGLTPQDKFSSENQDLMAVSLLKDRGIQPWTVGGSKYSKEEIAIVEKARRTSLSNDGQSSTTQSIQTSAPPPKPAPIQPGKRFKVNDMPTIGRGVNNIVITDLYGSRGGTHKGLDIAAPLGTYIALRYDCEVVATGTYGRYGLLIDVWVPQLKVQLRMSHLSAVLIKSGRIKAGTSFARVGQSGRATGPHIHFEYDTVKGRSNYGGSGDPSAYVSVLLLTNSPNQGSFSPAPAQVATPRPTPAQITPSGTQQRQQASQQLARQPSGPSIIIIEEEPPAQQPQGSIGGGGAMMIPLIINPLNSFITKKLLLDLAYT